LRGGYSQAVGARAARPAFGDFARGQFRSDYEDRSDLQSLRERRVERARATMDDAGLDALLCWKDENVRYLTGLRAQILQGKSALLNGCVLFREGPPVLLCSGGEAERARVVMPWIEELHVVPIMEADGLVRAAVETTIAPLLLGRGLREGAIGLDELSFCQFDALRVALPGATFADGDAIMQAARRIKFAEEITLIEEACAIADAVTWAAIDAVRPGARETDVVAAALHELYRLGGEMPHVATPFVASGEHMSPPNRIASDKIIRDGDVVFIDIGAGWSGYWGDVGRTVICGKPSRRQQEIYTAVHEALAVATATLAAGKTNDDVAAAVRETARKHGLAGNFISLFIGHGVGIGSNEPPYIGEDLPGAETVTLEPGMTFAVEPLIWLPGVRGGGGVRLEDTIVVTPEGGRPLSRIGWDERLLL
jgi:Xaa-Pro aminopeptidase